MTVRAIILAAGLGTRMKSKLPKVMHKLANLPLVSHVRNTVIELGIEKPIFVIGSDTPLLQKYLKNESTVFQTERLGTADAAKAAKEKISETNDTVLVLFGDTPLIKPETLRRLLDKMHKVDKPAVCVLGFNCEDTNNGYGRLIIENDELKAIVEAKDATDKQKLLTSCNSGVMAIDGKIIWQLIEEVKNKNSQSEYYLTDIVKIANNMGRHCRVVFGEESEFLGVNTRYDLAQCEEIIQKRLRRKALDNGVSLIQPDTVIFSYDTQLSSDVTVQPYVVFGPRVIIGHGVEIKSFSHLEDCFIEQGGFVGPFARIRPGTKIGQNCNIGNFVELKNASLADDVKVNHLSYMGDCSIGSSTNIGAGTITCNYDGFFKYRTEIKENVFIGSNTALVAPVIIGAYAMVAAGSIVNNDVPEESLAIGRGELTIKDTWAKAFREKRKADKENL